MSSSLSDDAVTSNLTSFCVFLRGINVAGKRSVTMSSLTEVLTNMGFTDVRSYLASGNVKLSSALASSDEVEVAIRTAMEKQLGCSTDAIAIPLTALQSLKSSDPYTLFAGQDVKFYITFMTTPIGAKQLPASEPTDSVHVFHAFERIVLSVGRLHGRQRYGFSNELVEKHYGVRATTRNWNTIVKMLR